MNIDEYMNGLAKKPCRACGIVGMHACPGPPVCRKCKYLHAPQNPCYTGRRWGGPMRA